MRRTQIALAAAPLLIAVLLAGCSGDGHEARASENPSSTTTSSSSAESSTASTPSFTGKTIPDGTYVKTVTRADTRSHGLPKDKAAEVLDEDGEAEYSYQFAGDRWTLLGTYDGVPDVGDLGTLTYDTEGNVALTSESDGCPGCVYTYDWKLNGKQLSMTIVGHDSTDGPEDLLVVRLVSSGDYTRQP
jgi:hypothetical protein